jgi:hypothetical protein
LATALFEGLCPEGSPASRHEVEWSGSSLLLLPLISRGLAALLVSTRRVSWRASKEIRRLAIEPQLTRHGGRIVKTMGDGLLLDFAMSPTLVGP